MLDVLAKSFRTAIALAVSKTGIDGQTSRIILKTSLAPAIGLAANEATAWSDVFGPLGYLVPIASIILHPTPPRAGFLRDLILNLLGVCISAGVTALAIFCVVKGREQSETEIINGVPYNAVASTVAAIWLVVQNYIISAVRYNYPWTLWAASACLVFSNYGMVYAVQFEDMNAGFTFLRQLLWAHFVGFGISTGVALFILPRNCREPFFDTVSKCTGQVRLTIQRHRSLMECIVRGDEIHEVSDSARKQHVAGLDALQTKLTNQVKDAQIECAWGALDAAETSRLTELLKDIMIPIVSLCQVPDVRHASLKAGAEGRTSGELEVGDEKWQDGDHLSQEFRELLGSVIGPFSGACEITDKALQCFEEVTPLNTSIAKTKGDRAATPVALEAEIERAMALLVDCKVNLTEAFDAQRRQNQDNRPSSDELLAKGQTLERNDQSQVNLQMVLYTLLLLWSILHKSRALVTWSRQVEHKRNHFVMPEMPFLAKLKSAPQRRSSKTKGEHVNQRFVLLSPIQTRRRLTSPNLAFIIHHLRTASNFFASPASGFGLRVTTATMCAAIVCFLPLTQDFYIKQHLVWAQYTVCFTMQGSAGQSLRTLIYRIGGTIVAASLAWVSWYIVVGIPAGVLVFYWLSMHVPMYLMATATRFYSVGTVSAFALTSILGNALEPDKTSAPHSTLVLGAIRLGTIAVGCFIGTLWTIFPFPASDHDGAKDSLAGCLASLADYHTGFHEIVRIRMKTALATDPTSRGRPMLEEHELAELHSCLLGQCKSKVQTLRTRLKFTKWNLPVDEPFPHTLYMSAGEKIDSLVRNMQLIAFTSQAFLDFLNTTQLKPSEASSPWLDDPFRTPHGFGVAALLSLLSYSVRTGAPLPWDLQPPSREQMLWKSFDEAEELFKRVKSIRDPGAATFALLRIGTRGLQRDLTSLTNVVRELVGERKFVWEPAGDETLT